MKIDEEMEDGFIMDGNDFVKSLSDKEIEQLMNEEFEPDYNIQRIVGTQKYQFNIKNLIYHVDMTESVVLGTNKKILSVKFRLINNPNDPHREDFQNDRQYQITLQNSQIRMTGTGNAQSVFKRVLGAMITHIKSFDPNYVTFVGDEHEEKLYYKIMNVTKKFVPFDYRPVYKNPIDGSELGTGEFWLEINK